MKFKLRDIVVNKDNTITFITNRAGKAIIVNLQELPQDNGKIIYEIVSVSGFPNCKHVSWTTKELTIR